MTQANETYRHGVGSVPELDIERLVEAGMMHRIIGPTVGTEPSPVYRFVRQVSLPENWTACPTCGRWNCPTTFGPEA